MTFRKYLAALVFGLLCLPGSVYATHLMGGEARYQYLGALGSGTTPFRYQITYGIYINCDANSNVPCGREEICYAIYSQSNNQRILTGGILRPGPPNPPACPFPTITPPLPPGCIVPGLNNLCIRYIEYTGTVDLPLSFSGYYAITDDGTRNATVDNLANPLGHGQSIFLKIAPPTRQNSSPIFSTTAVGVICIGDTVTITNNAVDPDGDLLVYSFAPAVDQIRAGIGAGCFNPNAWPATWSTPPSVPYNPGYTFSQPFGAGSFASINANTGATKYYVPMAGEFVVSVEVKEYRINASGTQEEIGSTRRELQIFARNCLPNPAPQLSTTPPLPSGQITVQAGQLATFQVRACDADTISITGNSILLSAPYNATFPSVSGKSICPTQLTSTFNWQTTCNDAGVYSVNVRVEDNGCPPKSSNAVYQIIINPFLGPAAISGPATICGSSGGPKTYSVPAGSAAGYQWSVLTGGTISGSATTNTVNVNWTGTGQHILRLITNSAQNCRDTVVQVISVVPGQNIQASADVSTCAGIPATLTASGAAAGNPYIWTPAGGLNTTTGSTVIATPLSTQTYTVTSTDTAGCSSSDQVIVTIHPTTATITAPSPVCIDAAPIILTATPAAGTFSGPGVTGATFNPATAGAGTFTITYSAIVVAGCTATATKIITVNPLPVVTFTPVAPLCVDGTTVTLTGSPTGGTFSGPGVTGSSFSPATAGVGTHTVTYSYTAATGCSNIDVKQIVVNPQPALTITGLLPAYCISTLPVTITGSPTPGTFTGPGIAGNVFTPATAGVGTHTITYSHTATTGCSNRLLQAVTVNPLPVVTIPNTVPSAACINAPLVNLTGNPAGGIFSGTGVTGNNFDPGAAGVGPHLITYTFTNANGCTNTATRTITVNPLPVVSFSGLNATYCVNALSATLTGSPSGGTFSGTGISGTTFNPATAGVGTFTVIYAYIDANSCASADTQSVEVIPAPVPTIQNLAASYCLDAAATTLTGSITGGTFSGPGISGSTFTPAIAGTGTHSITYSVTSGGCSGSVSQAVVVNALPSVGFTLPAVICENAAPLPLTGSPAGGTFSGTGISGSTFDPAVAGTGTFTITYSYTDANTCTNTAELNITVNAAPVVTLTAPASICENASPTTLTGNPASGTFSGPGVTGSTFNPTTAGVGTHTITYSFTNAANCSNTTTAVVTVNAKPAIAPLAGPPAVCPGLQGVPYYITGTPAASSYSWTVNGGTIASGQGTDTLTVNWGPTNPAAQVQLFITNASGCLSDQMTLTVSINQVLPTPTPTGADLAVCENAPNSTYSVPFTPGSVYTWQATGGNVVSGQGTNTVVIDWTTPGTGSLQVTETSTTNIASCLGVSAPLSVTVHPVPSAALAIAGDLVVCASTPTLNFTTSGGLPGSAYAWSFNGNSLASTGSTASSPTPAAPGSYSLTVMETSNQGCSGPNITVQVVVNEVPAPLSINGTAFVCPNSLSGQVFSVQGLPGSSFDWIISGGTIVSGQSSNSITVDFDSTATPKTLIVTETSSQGCAGTADTLNITPDLLRNELLQASVDESNFENEVDVTWDVQNAAVPGNSFVYRRPAGTTGWGIAGAGATSFTDQSVTPEVTSYDYQVRSVNACGDTLFSGIHRTVLFKASADPKGSTGTFSWSSYRGWTGGVKEYQLYRKLDNQANFELYQTTTDTTAMLRIGADAFNQCYRVKAISQDNAESWSNVACIDFENPITVYNVVSVNGSQQNRNFTIANVKLYPNNTLRIYNRWGAEVFKRSNYQNDWSPSELPHGVYFYDLELSGGKSYKGWFEIMK